MPITSKRVPFTWIRAFITSIRASITSIRGAVTTVRGRSTLLAALVVAAALLIGAVALLTVYRNQLLDSLDQTLTQQVADRARLLDQGNDPQALTDALQEESFVWIGNPDGTVAAVGGSVDPIDNPVPATLNGVSTLDLLVDESHGGEMERELMEIRVASATTADGALVIVAGSELETVDNAVAAIGRLFAIGSPALIALVAALTWFTTGKALRPVEDIRSQAAAISGTSLGQRVPVPSGRDEISHLAETMNAMLERIESHEYSLRQFTADASHELKSPVANLRALVDTADVDDPSWSVLQQQLVGESERLRDLVDNLLFLASHEAGRPPERTGRFSLDELLFTEAELLAAAGSVTVDLTGVQPAELTGSQGDLTRLVRNLVDNAARHAAGRIALAIEHDPSQTGSTTLLVSDDGEGIPSEDRERVFERFTRLDDARARGDGGSGLGLAIVKQIADSHGATVEIRTSPLGGAQFSVTFP